MTNTKATHTHFGTLVRPIPGTRRDVAGGIVVDVHVIDPRTTITHATVNVANLVEVAS